MVFVAWPLSPPMAARAETPTVLILGDSLSAAYGIGIEQGWVALLGQRMRARGLPDQVVNASISGETSAGGLSRLPALLARHRPTLLVVQLGANDGLRGLSLASLRDNLTAIVRLGRESGSRVLLIGIQLPPNYGAAFNDGFQAVFQEIAETQQVTLVPTLLAGVAEHWESMQPDGLHPVAAAQPRMLDNVWPALEPLLDPTAAATPR